MRRPFLHGVHLPQLCVAHMATYEAVNSTGHGASELTERRFSSISCMLDMIAWVSLCSMTCILAIGPLLALMELWRRSPLGHGT